MTAFISYQDELKEIWRDNVAVTKSLVLKQEGEYGDRDGYSETSEHYYRQFITKIPNWDNSIYSKTRNNLRGS